MYRKGKRSANASIDKLRYGLTPVEFLALRIDVLHVENILEKHARHVANIRLHCTLTSSRLNTTRCVHMTPGPITSTLNFSNLRHDYYRIQKLIINVNFWSRCFRRKTCKQKSNIILQTNQYIKIFKYVSERI